MWGWIFVFALFAPLAQAQPVAVDKFLVCCSAPYTSTQLSEAGLPADFCAGFPCLDFAPVEMYLATAALLVIAVRAAVLAVDSFRALF